MTYNMFKIFDMVSGKEFFVFLISRDIKKQFSLKPVCLLSLKVWRAYNDYNVAPVRCRVEMSTNSNKDY